MLGQALASKLRPAWQKRARSLFARIDKDSNASLSSRELSEWAGLHPQAAQSFLPSVTTLVDETAFHEWLLKGKSSQRGHIDPEAPVPSSTLVGQPWLIDINPDHNTTPFPCQTQPWLVDLEPHRKDGLSLDEFIELYTDAMAKDFTKTTGIGESREALDLAGT